MVKAKKAYLGILGLITIFSALAFLFYKAPLYDTIREIQYAVFTAGYFLLLAALIYKGVVYKGNINILVFKIASVLLSILFLWAAGEIMTRLFIGDELNAFAFGPVFNRFSKDFVKLNSKGFRDREHSVKKDAGVSRMLVLGDSYTYGYGIRNIENVYTNLLGKMMNRRGDRRWEIINTGVPGAGTEQEVGIFRDYLKYSPDVVLVGFHLNDVEGPRHAIMSYCLYEPFLPGIIGRGLRNVSYFYYFLETRYNRLLERLKWKMNYKEYMLDLYSDKSKDEWLAFDKNIQYLTDETRKRNIKLVICVFPIVADWKESPFKKMHKRIDDYFPQKGILAMDLLPYYEKIDYKKLLFSDYDSHPNELGHKIAAEEIYAFLTANGIR